MRPRHWRVQNNFDNRGAGDDSVIPDTKRFTIFAEAGYELTDRVDLYVEGLYNRRKTKTDASRQLFFFQFPGNADDRYGSYWRLIYLRGWLLREGSTCDPYALGRSA